jgi:hypothetical protein
MTPARSHAYGRVTRKLDDAAIAKLHPPELAALRTAADDLLFAGDEDEDQVEAALREAFVVLDRLVDAGRWTADRARALLRDLEACAPARALSALAP